MLLLAAKRCQAPCLHLLCRRPRAKLYKVELPTWRPPIVHPLPGLPAIGSDPGAKGAGPSHTRYCIPKVSSKQLPLLTAGPSMIMIYGGDAQCASTRSVTFVTKVALVSGPAAKQLIVQFC